MAVLGFREKNRYRYNQGTHSSSQNNFNAAFRSKDQLSHRCLLVRPLSIIFLPNLHFFHMGRYIQMEQEQSQSVVFENQDERRLFEMLTSKIKFQSQYYTQSDLSVDLVLRLPIPTEPYISRSQDYDFDYFFANAPDAYQKTYTTVKEYIHYQVDSDPTSRNFLQSMTKLMKSLMTLDQSKEINKTIKLGYEEQHFTINSFYSYFPEMDIFTLRYNTIMLILQTLCGFRVKTFVFDDQGQPAIYFLLSQSTDNILNLAARHQIIKELDMGEIDFTLNEPADRKGRPIRYQPQIMAEKRDKIFSRILKTTFFSLKSELIEEEQLSQRQLDRYRQYLSQYQQILHEVYTQQIEITNYEKQYAFTYNRRRVNQGCFQYLKQAKQRHMVFDKLIQLNQKFGYPHYRYQDAFFEFRLPPKKKAFFDKFQFMMNYKPSIISPQGELSLFNKMERTKLSNCCLERYFKMENLFSIGIEVFALNDNFEKYGSMTYEHSDYKVNKNIRGGLNGKRLVDSWHSLIPFLTDIRVVRDYMGQRFAYQTMMISHLISFFSIVFPVAVMAQLFGQYYFMAPSETFEYQFKLIYLVLMVVFLTVFSQSWRRKQDYFFKYYVDKQKSRPQKENYRGPFVRNMVTDEVNQHPEKMSLWHEIVRILVFLCLAVSLMFQGLIFYGLRKGIVRYYIVFPVIPFDYISLPHLIFYGIYFWLNYFLYMFVFSKLLVKFTDFQNIPTKQSYNSYLRAYNYIFTFGVELIGPLFLYVIEPFQGTSCYSSSCIYQFQYYVFSRFIVILAYILIKIAYASYYYCHAKVQQIRSLMDESQVNEKYTSYESKYAELLEHVQNQYNKEEIFFDMREEALCLYYYCIFSMTFPFCAAISFFTLLLDYVTIRLVVLKMGRRPISNSGDVMRFSQVYSTILHCCIIVNIWSIIYVQKVVEYDYATVVQSFVSTITADNLLMLKLATIFVLIIAFEIISKLVQAFYYVFVDDTLQNRKVNIYTNFLFNAKKAEMPVLQKVKEKVEPLKTVFRTFAFDDLRILKKGKFKGNKGAKQLQDLKDKWIERSMKTESKFKESETNGLNITMTAGASQHIIIDQIKQRQ